MSKMKVIIERCPERATLAHYVAVLKALIEHHAEITISTDYADIPPPTTKHLEEAILWAYTQTNFESSPTPYQIIVEAEDELAMWFKLRFS